MSSKILLKILPLIFTFNAYIGQMDPKFRTAPAQTDLNFWYSTVFQTYVRDENVRDSSRKYYFEFEN